MSNVFFVLQATHIHNVHSIYLQIIIDILYIDIQRRECSLKGFLSVVGESIDERESRKFKEGMESKVKLLLYRPFCEAVEFKAYQHGTCDAGSRLMFKFRSGTHSS